MAQAGRVGKRAGIDEFVLVTPPGLAARTFYERLGWRFDGELTSRSGERFVRYGCRLPRSRDDRRPLHAAVMSASA